jgi:hypothetical protein
MPGSEKLFSPVCNCMMISFVSREVTTLLRGDILLLVMKGKGNLVLSLTVPLHHLPNKGLVDIYFEDEVVDSRYYHVCYSYM